MNTALAKFMGIAVTAVVIVGLVFGVAYTMVQTKTTGGYQNVVNDADIPTKTAPTNR